MKLTYCITAVLGLALSIFSNQAHAYTALICNTCNTPADYELEAISISPDIPNSRYYYQIGNTITKTFYYVEVVIPQREGDIPASIPVRDPEQQSADTVFESRSSDNIAEAMHAGSISAAAVEASAWEKEQFAAMVRISEDQIMISSPGGYGFESFARAETALVSNALWAAMSAANPGWQQEFTGGFLGLWNALKLLYGKGPSGCIVFTNGDSACYQLNPADKNAALYLADSAKRVDGTLISSPDGIGGGGSDAGMDVMQYNHGGNNGYAYRTGGSTGELWLFCASSGGVLISCEIVVIM